MKSSEILTREEPKSFTPGPWSFLEERRTEEEYNAGRPLTICSSDNDDIAQVFSKDDSTVSISREEAIANARLFAASPDLYHALKAVVNYEASPDFTKWKGVIDRAKAALSKAEDTNAEG